MGGFFAAITSGISSWSASPQDAQAFRSDRILNARKKYVPKIRQYYQKLEGLRDDLYLEIELADQGQRVTYAARPADWYDGLDSKMDGPLALPTDDEGFGCSEYTGKAGRVVLVPRGRCTFVTKVNQAKAAGARSVVMWDEKMSKQPIETQGKVGAVRSKGTATRDAGDALTGGASLQPKENGITIMAPEPGTPAPSIDAVMISFTNGTELLAALKSGDARVLDVKRFDFTSNIDLFIKKDLKKMVNEMEIFSNTMRESKDDFKDPILLLLKKDREDFVAAVNSKDYGRIRTAFQKWNDDLDPMAKWDLTETF